MSNQGCVGTSLSSPRALCLPALFAACLASQAYADVLVVDRYGNGDYTDLQPAVDAASEGDTVLVHDTPSGNPGPYTHFVIDGKSLSLVGSGEMPRAYSGTVLNLDSSQSVVVSGLSIQGLQLRDNEGPVFVSGCRMYGRGAPYQENLISACRAVVLVDCVITGRSGSQSEEEGVEGEPGGVGLQVVGSRVALYGGQLRGGYGGAGIKGYYVQSNGGPGGEGIVLDSSQLYVAGTALDGGEGGWSLSLYDNGYGGDGGTGLSSGPGSSALVRDVLLAGGAGGGGYPAGQDGAARTGPVTIAPGPALELRVPNVALRGEEVELRLDAPPGTRLAWFASEHLAWSPRGVRPGVLHAGAPVERFAEQVVPACGEVVVSYRAPAATAGLGVVVQAAVLGPDDTRQFSAPAFLPVADSLGHPDCGGRFYVDADAPAGGDGSAWASAFDSLTTALDQVPACNEHTFEVWVAQGTYTPEFTGPGGPRRGSFALGSGTRLYGGFGGFETSLRERDSKRYRVILSGDLAGDDQTTGLRTDNVYNVVRVGDGIHGVRAFDVVIDGVVIEGGQADGGTSLSGGGVKASGGLELRDCVIRDCFAEYIGGGVAFSGTYLRMSGCLVAGNLLGGGIPSHRHAAGVSAGVSDGGRISIVNTAVVGNVGAGGLRVEGAPDATMEVRHCTVANNVSPYDWAGMRVLGSGLAISNTILWGNRGLPGPLQLQQIEVTSGPSLDYMCIEGLDGTLPGAGHVGVDPLFVDPLGSDGIPGTEDDDLRLAFGSPCVDAGSSSLVGCDSFDVDHDGDPNERILTDLLGKRRFRDDPAAADTGEGPGPIIDMGAFERVP